MCLGKKLERHSNKSNAANPATESTLKSAFENLNGHLTPPDQMLSNRNISKCTSALTLNSNRPQNYLQKSINKNQVIL